MEKKVSLKSIILMHSSALILSFSNVFAKLAANQDNVSINFIFYYFMALFIMFVYAILWQIILKNVGMTVAYSNRMITIVWGMIWGKVLFSEKITIPNIIGSIIIMIGLFIMIGDKENE